MRWKWIAAAVLTLALLLWLNGNLLLFPEPAICLGWPDDLVASWACWP